MPQRFAVWLLAALVLVPVSAYAQCDPACGDAAYPTCGGRCPAGFVCLPVLLESPIGPTFPDCRCAPVGVACVGPHDPQSCEGGTCPPGLACHMFTLFGCSAYSCIDQSSFP